MVRTDELIMLQWEQLVWSSPYFSSFLCFHIFGNKCTKRFFKNLFCLSRIIQVTSARSSYSGLRHSNPAANSLLLAETVNICGFFTGSSPQSNMYEASCVEH